MLLGANAHSGRDMITQKGEPSTTNSSPGSGSTVALRQGGSLGPLFGGINSNY
jgi:hypothetical protein